MAGVTSEAGTGVNEAEIKVHKHPPAALPMGAGKTGRWVGEVVGTKIPVARRLEVKDEEEMKTEEGVQEGEDGKLEVVTFFPDDFGRQIAAVDIGSTSQHLVAVVVFAVEIPALAH